MQVYISKDLMQVMISVGKKAGFRIKVISLSRAEKYLLRVLEVEVNIRI